MNLVNTPETPPSDLGEGDFFETADFVSTGIGGVRR